MEDRTAELAAELAREQAYFDDAAGHRERRREALGEAASAAANPVAAARLRRYGREAEQAADGTGAVAFGRTDDESGETFYIGRQLVRDGAEVLVVNWQAPAAAPYYEASHADPHGLRRRRSYECDGNTIRDFTDVVFAGPAVAVDQHLLRELGRGRTGAMRDIVATIQAAQYDIIRSPAAQLLVIEGGPGTGKTAVALHRVAWLRFHHREQVGGFDVLVVGPHPTFIHYLRDVLPGLGEEQVELRDVGRLAPEVRRGRSEPVPVSRLKGDDRMAGLLARALAARIGEPEPAERLLLAGRFVTLPGHEVAELVADCRSGGRPYADGRRQLRERLAALVRARSGAEPDGQEALANLVERLWPLQSAPVFLRELFGSRRRLRVAAGDALTPDEQELLYRRGADRVSEEVWSPADLPLLDEAAHLIEGAPRRYRHVVVDEAQDLSPMQLRSVARRAGSGGLTVVGDLAQSTGPWARDDWADVTRHLPPEPPVTLAPLRYGYRVPRPVYQLAARLLPVAAPQVVPPEVVRDGPEPRIHQVGLADRAGRVVAVATGHADAGRFVGIICPPRCRREVEAALAANGVEWSSADRGELGAAVNLVSPLEAKGLEFDAVVVVEPEEVVTGDPRGHRLLYVALTRTIRQLDIVCVGEPVPLTVPAGPEPAPPAAADPDPAGADGFSDRDARRLAAHLAARLRSAAPRSAWRLVHEELARLLDEERTTPEDREPAG